jgi:hypothetical protein
MNAARVTPAPTKVGPRAQGCDIAATANSTYGVIPVTQSCGVPDESPA